MLPEAKYPSRTVHVPFQPLVLPGVVVVVVMVMVVVVVVALVGQ